MAHVRLRKPPGGGFLAVIEKAGRLIPKAAMDRLGRWLVDDIRKRTLSGRSTTGRRFTPYSPAYAAAKGVPRGNVTLSDTGRMLRQLRFERTTKSVRVSVRGSRGAVAAAHESGSGVPRRAFIGLSPPQQKRFRREIRKEIRAIIPKR